MTTAEPAHGRLAGILGLHPTDIVVGGKLATMFAVIQAGHGLGSNTGDALFFIRFGVECLPRMILPVGHRGPGPPRSATPR